MMLQCCTIIIIIIIVIIVYLSIYQPTNQSTNHWSITSLIRQALVTSVSFTLKTTLYLMNVRLLAESFKVT